MITIKNVILLVVLSILVFGAFVATSQARDDNTGEQGKQRLWSTDVNGLTEINTFQAGDPIYLKTDDNFGNYPLGDGKGGVKYRVYIFAGNLFTGATAGDPIFEGKPISTLTPVVPPTDITTDSNGRFGTVVGLNPGWATPILLWNSATPGQFTIVLDRVTDYVPGNWEANNDLRDDLCTTEPTSPIFWVIPRNVIPEAGTVLLVAAMFGSVGLFIVVKRKNRSL